MTPRPQQQGKPRTHFPPAVPAIRRAEPLARVTACPLMRDGRAFQRQHEGTSERLHFCGGLQDSNLERRDYETPHSCLKINDICVALFRCNPWNSRCSAAADAIFPASCPSFPANTPVDRQGAAAAVGGQLSHPNGGGRRDLASPSARAASRYAVILTTCGPAWYLTAHISTAAWA